MERRQCFFSFIYLFIFEPTTVTVQIQENLDWLLKTRVFSTVLIKKKAKKERRKKSVQLARRWQRQQKSGGGLALCGKCVTDALSK